ncbi:MAG: tyrosine-type recombinase/integrase [Acidimicrobiales bacterium]
MTIASSMADSSGTHLRLLVEDYLDSCRARGLSRGTVDLNYSYPINEVFLLWLENEGITELTSVSQRILDRFTGSLLRDGGKKGVLSPHTVHSYVRAVRQFLAWAERQGEGVSGARPQLPRLPRRVVEVLSREEIDEIEAAAPTERDKIIVRLLADTGMRVSELCGLSVGDLRRHQRGALLKVRGKGDKERLIPVRPSLARRLDIFVRGRPKAVDSDHLFVAKRLDAAEVYPPLTRNGVLLMIRSATHRVGINKRVYPHLFRHSFATEALRRGMNPLQLANILGHSGLTMIERTYSHLNSNDAYDALVKMLESR